MGFNYDNAQEEYETLQAAIHKMMNRRLNMVDSQICDYLSRITKQDRSIAHGSRTAIIVGIVNVLVMILGIILRWQYVWIAVSVLTAVLIMLAVYTTCAFRTMKAMVGRDENGSGFRVESWDEETPEYYVSRPDQAATLLRDGAIVGVDRLLTTTHAFKQVLAKFPKIGERAVQSGPMADVAYVMALGKVWAVEGEHVGVEFTVSSDDEFHWADVDNKLNVVAVPKQYWLNCVLNGDPDSVAEAYMLE